MHAAVYVGGRIEKVRLGIAAHGVQDVVLCLGRGAEYCCNQGNRAKDGIRLHGLKAAVKFCLNGDFELQVGIAQELDGDRSGVCRL